MFKSSIRPFINSIRSLQYSPSRYLSVQPSEMITFEQRHRVGLITLNRPKALNALCDQLMAELRQTVQTCDNSEEIGAVVITGSEKSFAAGADLKEMCNKTWQEAYTGRMLDHLLELGKTGIPIITAVNGFALGGGLELALLGDVMYAGTKGNY